jgi:peptide/nickel transport system substrate-binding protein
MEPLSRLGDDGQPEPALAERWETLSPTVWRFHLRHDVEFSSGNPFTADDVLLTVERAQNPKSPIRGLTANIKGVTKVDPYTVDMETNGPDPTLLRELPSLLILDSKWVREHDAVEPTDPGKNVENYLSRHTSGTGPFILTKYQPGVGAELVANPKWWDNPHKLHNLSKVTFRPIKSDATRVAALLSGEVDLIDPVPLEDIPRVEKTPGFKVIVGPSARDIMLGLNVSNPELVGSNVTGKNPFKDIRVRKAIYQAIDVDAIVSKVMDNFATPAAVIVAPGISGYDSKLEGRILPYDPAAAKKLLAEAGYPDGFGFQLECPAGRYVNDEKVCLSIAPMLAKIGLDVKVNAQPPAQFFGTVLKGQANMFLYGFGTDLVLDGNLFLTDLMHTPDGASLGAWNPGGYSNPRIDAIQRAAANEMDAAKRHALLVEAFQISKDDVAFIPLYNEKVTWGVSDKVHITPTINDILWLQRVHIE